MITLEMKCKLIIIFYLLTSCINNFLLSINFNLEHNSLSNILGNINSIDIPVWKQYFSAISTFFIAPVLIFLLINLDYPTSSIIRIFGIIVPVLILVLEGEKFSNLVINKDIKNNKLKYFITIINCLISFYLINYYTENRINNKYILMLLFMIIILPVLTIKITRNCLLYSCKK